MTQSSTYKASDMCRARAEPPLVKEDIDNLLTLLNMEQTRMTGKKPTLLFVGDSGVGKSSCIKVILNLTEETHGDILHKMNISHYGKEGTSMPVFIKGDYLNCVDVRGKRSKEEDGQYNKEIQLDHLLDNDEFSVDLIVGVVKADNERNFDIENMFYSLQFICDKFNKPFLVLMNFADNILSDKRHQMRQEWLESQCQGIQKKSSWYTIRRKTLSQGIFTVSACPRTSLPTTDCIKSTKNAEVDLLASSHSIIYICSSIRYCQQCKHAEVVTPSIDTEDKNKHAQALDRLNREPGATITFIQAAPVGLSASCPAITAAIDITDDLAGVAVLKSVAHSLDDRLANSAIVIEKITNDTYTQRTAQTRDQQLCAALMDTFDLPKSGFTQAQFEFTQWIKVHEEWILRGVWRWLTRDQVLINYLIAWGIYYACKFRSLSQTIADGWAAGLNAEEIRLTCQTSMSKYNDALQRIYFDYINEHDSKQAFQKFLGTDKKSKKS